MFSFLRSKYPMKKYIASRFSTWLKFVKTVKWHYLALSIYIYKEPLEHKKQKDKYVTKTLQSFSWPNNKIGLVTYSTLIGTHLSLRRSAFLHLLANYAKWPNLEPSSLARMLGCSALLLNGRRAFEQKHLNASTKHDK